MSSGPEGLLQRTHLSRYPEEPPGTWFPQIAEGTVPSPDMTVRTEAAHGEGQLSTEAGSCKKVTLCSESKVSSCRKIPQDDVDLHASSHTHGIRCPVRAGFQPRNIESGIVSQEWAHYADHCLPAELMYSDHSGLPKEQLAEGPVPSPDMSVRTEAAHGEGQLGTGVSSGSHEAHIASSSSVIQELEFLNTEPHVRPCRQWGSPWLRAAFRALT